MTDTEKLQLCRAIIASAFEWGCDTADACGATMNALLTVIDFGEEVPHE